MKGYKYQSYDYSFLHTEKESCWSRCLKAAAKTIGFDLAEAKPINGPTGILYWMDYTYPTSTTTSATGTYTVSTNSGNYVANSFDKYFQTIPVTGPSAPVMVSNYNDFTTVYTR